MFTKKTLVNRGIYLFMALFLMMSFVTPSQFDRPRKNWPRTKNVIIMISDGCGYLCGPGSAASRSMQPIVNNGIGVQSGMEWNSGFHTNSLIPFYSKGIRCKLFEVLAFNEDPIRGPYIDNRDVAIVIFQLLGYFDSELPPPFGKKRESTKLQE